MYDRETTHSDEIFKEIFADLLNSGKSVRLKALGGSMYPTIKNGEYVIIKAVDYGDVRVGDIIAYQNIKDKRIVIHRLVKKINPIRDSVPKYRTRKTLSFLWTKPFSNGVNLNKSPVLITKGDNHLNKSTDTPICLKDYVLGKVINIEKGNRIINLEDSLSRFNNYLLAKFLLYSPRLFIVRRYFIRAMEDPGLIPIKLYQNLRRIFCKFKKFV